MLWPVEFREIFDIGLLKPNHKRLFSFFLILLGCSLWWVAATMWILWPHGDCCAGKAMDRHCNWLPTWAAASAASPVIMLYRLFVCFSFKPDQVDYCHPCQHLTAIKWEFSKWALPNLPTYGEQNKMVVILYH